MAMSLITITHPDGRPSTTDVARTLGVDPTKIDASFGVADIDPKRGLYAVQVDQDAAAGPLKHPLEGPWSNPRIESFGPAPESEEKE